jgi:hypothetical protein
LQRITGTPRDDASLPHGSLPCFDEQAIRNAMEHGNLEPEFREYDEGSPLCSPVSKIWTIFRGGRRAVRPLASAG